MMSVKSRHCCVAFRRHHKMLIENTYLGLCSQLLVKNSHSLTAEVGFTEKDNSGGGDDDDVDGGGEDDQDDGDDGNECDNVDNCNDDDNVI